MKVLVTGGTGFIGSHTVAAALAAGHTVRLLVRSPDRVGAALDPLGGFVGEVVVGDVTDPDAVRRALSGCDAALHAASVYSMDSRRIADIERTNVAGTRVVLGEAAQLGLDPIIYVSSGAAFFGHGAGFTIDEDAEPRAARSPYLRSKAEAELVARGFQERGVPVAITYPATVFGPHDPHLGESCRIMMDALRFAHTISIPGGFSVADVRDVAALHVELLEQGRGPRRYLAPATRIGHGEFLRQLSLLTGRRLPTFVLPGWLVLPQLRLLDWLQRFAPFRFPVNYTSAYGLHLDLRWNDAKVRRELGIVGRDVGTTLRDTLAWLVEQGHVTRAEAGRFAAELGVGSAA